ncbi:P-loop containing nucleoside triphosphate hydrolase protein [Ilyonectria robusta]|uniref:P-loop containing nucleoside triphosphate hydrolase protein n=1 Tax=Ilyonectria robusta TaxID=1079257 RepID=UPI001E8E5ED2|nr:P-loop containing nucleoside triphosphate hydrolase protein [Ilyonectria robusta]KAH8737039.1 P-loop containing nucleoside triphosphate hydrolase protein [Ilyonectria robusta]
MARPRDSRSPSPAGSPNSSRRPRKDDDRRDRDRRDDGRDHPRGTRSRSPDVRKHHRNARGLYSDEMLHEQPRYRNRDRDRDNRDRARDRDYYHRRDRSLDRRDDDYYRGGRRDRRDRDRRRSRDRFDDRNRSPDRQQNRSRGGDRDFRRREDSRDRARGHREGTADSHARSIRDESRHQKTPMGDSGNASSNEAQKPKATASQAEVDKKAERLAKLEAWKKKKEIESQKQKEVNPSQTRNLLAEMDMKASGASSRTVSPVVSAVASPATKDSPSAASPVTPYTGKFDPKAIAKKSAASRSHEAGKPVLGAFGAQPETVSVTVKQTSTASALPANRLKASGFGFTKSHAENDKLPSKRKLDLDEEDTTKRKLTKLPALPIETDDTPYADQDEDDEEDGDVFAETEEEAAAAARAAHEKRLQAESQAAQSEQESKAAEAQTNGQAATNGEPEKPASPEQMDVDEGDGVDPLDAFMADLKQTDVRKPAKASVTAKVQEPEAYFSDDDYAFKAKEEGDANAFLAMTNKRKKKDIPSIDYTKIEIEPIRKNFWVEPAELSSLTEAEVADLRLELDGIKVNGKDVPKPVQKWAQCGLTRQTLDVIEHLGYEKPTPIQMQAVPAIMSGRDVVGVAKTGSGKTVAFLLPMFRHIKDQTPLKDTDGPIGLIMTPTRELATQIHRDCKPFLKMMGLRSVCAYGGAPIREQIAELKRGAEIVVCTPGRMIDLLAANQGRVTNLKRVSYVVLDEADRMFDMGFEPQVMKIFANMRPDRQTILFSATMPRIIDSLTKKVLKAPVEITVGGRSVVAKEIEQIVEVREETTKFLRILELLGDLYDRDEDARTLIFVERQEKADDLLKELMMKGYPCMSIHGGKDQIDRDSTISDFKKGVVPILIATSVAARGLDVKQLKLVVNYDAPNHLEDYVHRAGRTGRAGNTGVAVTFVTPEQENCAPGIAKALEQSGQPVPERLNEMRKAHREKVKSGKAKDTSGFGGKGLDRLDQEREAARLRERKTHKAEGEEEEDKEEKKDDEEKAEKALSAIRAAASGVQSRETAKTEQPEVKPVQPVIHGPTATTKDSKAKDPLDKVSSAVSAINSRLGKAGQLRAGQPIDNKGPDAGAYHATLEINDFPQKARWAVTNRTNVAKILEATGTSITTKGNFYPLGKEVPAGAEPKLYILIEGDTEVVVSSALTELTRLLREGTIAAADADSRAPASGRYTIT